MRHNEPPANYEVSAVVTLPDGRPKTLLMGPIMQDNRYKPIAKVTLQPEDTLYHYVHLPRDAIQGRGVNASRAGPGQRSASDWAADSFQKSIHLHNCKSIRPCALCRCSSVPNFRELSAKTPSSKKLLRVSFGPKPTSGDHQRIK